MLPAVIFICLPPFTNGTQTTLCELLKARAWEGFEWLELKQPATNPKTSQQALKIRKPGKGTFLSKKKFLLAGFGIFRSKEDPGSFKNPKTSQKELFCRRKSSFLLVFSLKSLEKNIRTLLLCCFSFASSCNICFTLCELLKSRAWEGFEWLELKQPATNPKTSQQALKIRKPGKRNFSVGEKVPFGWFWNI